MCRSIFPEGWLRIGYGITALHVPDEPSIAVLPFESLIADPSQDCLSDGLTDDINTSFSTLPATIRVSHSNRTRVQSFQ